MTSAKHSVNPPRGTTGSTWIWHCNGAQGVPARLTAPLHLWSPRFINPEEHRMHFWLPLSLSLQSMFLSCTLVLASFLPNIYQRWFCLKKTHNLPGTHYAWFQVSHNVIYYYSDDRSYELTIKVTVLQAGFCTPTYCNGGKNQKMCLIIIKFTSSLYTTVGSFQLHSNAGAQ